MYSQLYIFRIASCTFVLWARINLYNGIESRKRGDERMKTKIRELRKERRISQEELAVALHVTRHTIMSIENEKYTASLPLAYKVSKFFGLSIEDIFDFSDVEDTYDEVF